MKKYFLLIAAAATVFAVSCRKAREVEQVTPETPQEEIDDTTPQPVRFGSSLNIQVDTKAAVTNFETTDDLYVLGFQKDMENGGKFVFTGAEPFIPNVKANLEVATTAYHPTTYDINVYYNAQTQELFYYTDGEVYDFLGYYLGGAYRENAQEAQEAQAAVPYADFEEYNEAKGTNLTADEFAALSDEDKIKTPAVPAVPAIPATLPVYNEGAEVGNNGTVNKITIPVTIDGTNDIMLAKTDHEFDVQNRADDSKYVPENKMYSSYSARRTVKPNLKFDHQLSRFIFRTKKGGTVPTNHITITQIALESKTQGDLVLYGDAAEALHFVPSGDASYIPLKAAANAEAVNYTDYVEYNQLNDTNLTEGEYGALDAAQKVKTPAQVAGEPATGHPGHNDYVQLGESIMVFPDAATYKFKLSLAQVGVTREIADQTLTIDLRNLPDQKAIPGHQYTVDLIVYGLEKVEVTVSLTEWVEAGTVEIDPDADVDDNRPAGVITLGETALTISKATGESARFAISTTGGMISGSSATDGIALVAVPATYYDAAGAISHNAGLTGAKAAGNQLSAEEAAAYNATLGMLAADVELTADQAAAYNTAMNPATAKAAGDQLSAEEAAAYNATLGMLAAGVDLTADQAAAYNATLAGAVSEGDQEYAAGYKVTVEAGVANGAHTLTVHSAGTFTVKPADKDIAITVTD